LKRIGQQAAVCGPYGHDHNKRDLNAILFIKEIEYEHLLSATSLRRFAKLFPMQWNKEVDLLSVGSGFGGLVAAIRGHDLGLETMVVEKSSKIGGAAAYSLGLTWTPNNHVMRSKGIRDSTEEAIKLLDGIKGVFPIDEALRRKWLEVAPIAAEYLETRCGVRWQLCELADPQYPVVPGSKEAGRLLEVSPLQLSELGDFKERILLTPHYPYFITVAEVMAWGGPARYKDFDFELISKRISEEYVALGPGLIAYLVKAAISRNVPILTEVPARELIRENSRVVGVRCEKEGEGYYIRTKKGVVLNLGGYDWHPVLPLYYERVSEWHSIGPPSIEGDHIVLGSQVGAIILHVPLRTLKPLGFHIPGEEHFDKPLYRYVRTEPGYPHFILVNKKGERFADESKTSYLVKVWEYDYAKLNYPNFPTYAIWDEQFREDYPLGSVEPGKPYPEGMVEKAENVTELSRKLGVDGENLSKTIERFNKFARAGVDEDFGRGSQLRSDMFCGDLKHKPNPNLGTIEKPPFYGLKFCVASIAAANCGYRIDQRGRVLDFEGNPIPNLFACGNCVAATELGTGYQDGAMMSRSMTFGYIAAEEIKKGGN
jgi:3-oxosteroid 1-dehydrogenase